MCDSLQYSFKDSVINLEVNPVIWSESNQITADSIRVYMKEGGIKAIHMKLNTFIISEKDSGNKYNQIKGRNAIAYFKEKRLKQIDVHKDVENIYYIEEDTGKYIGMQRIICGDLSIVLTNNKVSKVKYFLEPTGDMHPIDKIPAGQERLDGFVWHIDRRPLSREDVTPIYNPNKKTAPRKTIHPIKQKTADKAEFEKEAPFLKKKKK